MILNIIYLVGGLAIGIVIGTFVWTKYMNVITLGTLRQASDSDGRYLFLELDCPPEKVKELKFVMFKVNPEDYDTQE